jgi:putative glutamine amidotransferase
VAVLAGRSPAERYSVHRGYIDAVSAVGGLAVMVPAGGGIDPLDVAEWVLQADAVIVSGGGDVDPLLYGAEAGPELMEVDLARDLIELEAVRAAMAAGRRVLGVCRGVQVMAVATGGTLLADIGVRGYRGHWEEERQYQPVHEVKAEPGSIAESVLGDITEVNSIHHQAVADPGPVLEPSAWAPDGLIEAVEGPTALGVQWHPERLCGKDARHLGPFRWLVGR